ncbi:MAG: methyltransferase domain-containing protein [Lachnospiraceae bacterium]|nr:methyltransferase domain-containing protein [Lachnospiraceae bacterium]
MNNVKYDAEYYQSHCGTNYERNNGWEEIFSKQAARIIRELPVNTVLDAGCAVGYLVEGLRDRGVDAEGIDISEYALSCAREDIKPYCHLQSLTDPISKKYDLITCIEVMEHLKEDEIADAIDNLCNASDQILFSSTPFDYEEETHVSVHSPEYWVEQFAYRGFYHDVRFDASFISVQAMLFRRGEKSVIDLIRDYESALFQKHQENVALRHQRELSNENVEIYKTAYQKHVDMINQELNPKINELTKQIEEMSAKKEEAFQQRFKEQELAFKEQLAEKEIEYRKQVAEIELQCDKKCREQEDCFRQSFMEEVDKSRQLEEQLLICRREKEEQEETLNGELRNLQRQIGILQSEAKSYLDTINVFIRSGSVSVQSFLKERYRARKEGKRLMDMEKGYWDPVFDPDCYAEYNPDIRKAYGKDPVRLLNHFICYGMSEGRRAKESFDVNSYIEYNPDLVKELKTDIRAYYLHYITSGQKDGRRAV